MENLWAFVIVGGPIILGLAILYATVQYRKRNRDLDRVSEQGAKDVRAELREEERQVSR